MSESVTESHCSWTSLSHHLYSAAELPPSLYFLPSLVAVPSFATRKSHVSMFPAHPCRVFWLGKKKLELEQYNAMLSATHPLGYHLIAIKKARETHSFLAASGQHAVSGAGWSSSIIPCHGIVEVGSYLWSLFSPAPLLKAGSAGTCCLLVF